MNEADVQQKLALIRRTLDESGLGAVRLRGVDWFAWATGGGSSVVLLAAETGVAELLIGAHDAWLLTDPIEHERLRTEELPKGLFESVVTDWFDAAARERAVRGLIGSVTVASDRPVPSESPLPLSLVRAKRRLSPADLERYRKVGRLASEAMTAALAQARPEWTEFDLAAVGARELWSRGLHPALTLAAGESRVERYRHPTPSSARLGSKAMLVFCARGHGLYANLTRFVCFRELILSEDARFEAVGRIEAEALAASRPGTSLDTVIKRIHNAYARLGIGEHFAAHHQGGTTGYLSRELVARPGLEDLLEEGTPIAWNPSLPGAKIEDTFVVAEAGLEILTWDPAWPSVRIDGRDRPAAWIRRDIA